MARQDGSNGTSSVPNQGSEVPPETPDDSSAREEHHEGIGERAVHAVEHAAHVVDDVAHHLVEDTAHVVEDAAHAVEDAAHRVEDVVHAVESPFLRWATAHPKQVQWTIWGFIAVVMAIGFTLFFTGNLDFGNAGYIGAFLANLIASAAIVLPAPGLFAVCAAAAEGLNNNPFLLALAGAVGSALGETTAWLAGFSEHKLVEKFKWYPKIHDWMDRGGGLTIFIASAIPNPLFDFAGIAAGALGYSYRKFILFTTLGRSVRYIATVYLCRAGIDWVTNNANSGGIMDGVRNWFQSTWESFLGIFSTVVLPLASSI